MAFDVHLRGGMNYTDDKPLPVVVRVKTVKILPGFPSEALLKVWNDRPASADFMWAKLVGELFWEPATCKDGVPVILEGEGA